MSTTDQKLKTRIAPTPSGYLHEGNAFSFVITAVVAHLAGAEILLRIDDLDRARYRTEYADDIFRTLEFLGIEWQEGPQNTTQFEKHWSQHHRLELYRESLNALEKGGHIFACKCSRREVEQHSTDGGYHGACREIERPLCAKNTALRIKTDQRGLSVKLWPQGEVQDYLPAPLRDFVVRRKDGIPAYQLASVADDLYFGVDLIVRGQDLYDSTLAQLFLAGLLHENAFLQSRFFHHSLITRPAGEKLSKSAGDGAVSRMRGKHSADFYRQLSRWLLLHEEVQNLDELKMYAEKHNILARVNSPKLFR